MSAAFAAMDLASLGMLPVPPVVGLAALWVAFAALSMHPACLAMESVLAVMDLAVLVIDPASLVLVARVAPVMDAAAAALVKTPAWLVTAVAPLTMDPAASRVLHHLGLAVACPAPLTTAPALTPASRWTDADPPEEALEILRGPLPTCAHVDRASRALAGVVAQQQMGAEALVRLPVLPCL